MPISDLNRDFPSTEATGQAELRFRPATKKKLCDSGLSVVVTGATGWLGQATLALLDGCFGAQMAERTLVFSSAERCLTLPSGRSILAQPLSALADVSPQPLLFLHYAFLGKEKTVELSLNDFVARNDEIGEFVVTQTRRLQPRGVFIPSSGAVYRSNRELETDLQCNPYGAMKVRDENRFRFLSESRDIRLIVCRVFNLAGPFINKLSSYALSSILLDILNARPIRLRADRPVLRSYLHIGDLCELAILLLLSHHDAPGLPFDTAGEVDIELSDMASRCCRLLGQQVAIERPPFEHNAPDRYIGDGATLRRLMAIHGLDGRSLDRQIVDTAAYLRS